MRRHRKIQPRVARHFPSLSEVYKHDPNVHMFTEDVHLAIMPIGGKTAKHPEFKITIEGNENDCKQVLILCNSLAEYEHRDINKLVCDAVDRVTLHLAWQGRALYEIMRDKDDQIAYYLAGFTDKNLIRVPGFYVQRIPSKDYQYFKKRFIAIPSRDVWEVTMPTVLGGTSGYKKMLSSLRKFKHLGPVFWRNDLEKGIQTRDFNFQEYVLNTEIYHTKITRLWGWNRRDYSQRNCTEFFMIYKGITFRWAQALLREHIIDELNKLLARLQIKAKILVTGIPSSDDILKIRKDIIERKIKYAKAYDLTQR